MADHSAQWKASLVEGKKWGDLEYHEDGYIFRGPISKIEWQDGQQYVQIYCKWVAVMVSPNGGHVSEEESARMHRTGKPWCIKDNKEVRVVGFSTTFCRPYIEEDTGRVHTSFFSGTFAMLFPADHKSRLDPNDVDGLQV